MPVNPPNFTPVPSQPQFFQSGGEQAFSAFANSLNNQILLNRQNQANQQQAFTQNVLPTLIANKQAVPTQQPNPQVTAGGVGFNLQPPAPDTQELLRQEQLRQAKSEPSGKFAIQSLLGSQNFQFMLANNPEEAKKILDATFDVVLQAQRGGGGGDIEGVPTDVPAALKDSFVFYKKELRKQFPDATEDDLDDAAKRAVEMQRKDNGTKKRTRANANT